jgi:hypothetical protein
MTIVDWRPLHDWLAVEGCRCGGFFIWSRVWTWRLPVLPPSKREAWAARVRTSRVGGREVYLSTADGTITGAITIFPKRPIVWSRLTANPTPSSRTRFVSRGWIQIPETRRVPGLSSPRPDEGHDRRKGLHRDQASDLLIPTLPSRDPRQGPQAGE